jgi:hypothetical protein
VLPGHLQHLPAGRQYPQAGRRAQQRVGQLGAGLHQVLAVVQYQQQLLISKELRKQRHRVAAPGVVDLQSVDHRVRHQCGVLQRGQLDQPHPVGDHAPKLRRHPQCQPGLPDSRHTGQRHQPRQGQPLGDLGDVTPPAHEARHVGRKVSYPA